MNYDDFTKRITDSYSLFLAALSGKYQTAVVPGATITPNAVNEFAKDARALGRIFIHTVENEVSNYVLELHSGFVPVSREAKADANEFIEQILECVKENIAQAVKALRVGVTEYRRLLKSLSGAMSALLQKKLNSIDYKVYDTSNRKWDATTLVKLVARNFAYQVCLDVTISYFLSEGYTLGKAVWDNKDRQPVIISLDKQIGDYPTFKSVRGSLFHINSTARLISYVPT